MKKLAIVLAFAAGCSLNSQSLRQDGITYIKDTNHDGHIDTRVTLYGKPLKTVTEKDTDYNGKMDIMVSAEVLKADGKIILEEIVQIDQGNDGVMDYEALLTYERRGLLESHEFSVYERKNKRPATDDEIGTILDLINKCTNP